MELGINTDTEADTAYRYRYLAVLLLYSQINNLHLWKICLRLASKHDANIFIFILSHLFTYFEATLFIRFNLIFKKTPHNLMNLIHSTVVLISVFMSDVNAVKCFRLFFCWLCDESLRLRCSCFKEIKKNPQILMKDNITLGKIAHFKNATSVPFFQHISVHSPSSPFWMCAAVRTRAVWR